MKVEDEARSGIPATTCGARTRKGSPCRAPRVTGKRRCKLHGGLSTGPRTAEGRARIAQAQRLRHSALRVTRHGTSKMVNANGA